MPEIQKTFFDKKFESIRVAFDKFRLDSTQPEHREVCALFCLYDDAMSWFYSYENYEERDKDMIEEWEENLQLAGIRAHRLYKNLKDQGIEVEYDKFLLKNRIEDCKTGPDELAFHLHHEAVEDLLNFCILGTGDTKKLKKLREEYAGSTRS